MKPQDALLAAGGAVALPVQGRRRGQRVAGEDWVAEEVPVALEFNGIAHAVMLATPTDLTDFALGFALSEGLVEHAAQFYGVEAHTGPLGITLEVEIAAAAFARLKERRRNMAGRTGCGLCGTESLQQVVRPLPPLGSGPRFAAAAIERGLDELRALQALHRVTGGTHAAGWCRPDGTLVLLREDLGRHNAIDKLIGALVHARVAAHAGFALVTSRASFEMVQKAASAGIRLLAAVSAPTSLAVQAAERCGLTLACFARGADLAVYAHADRLGFDDRTPPPCTTTTINR